MKKTTLILAVLAIFAACKKTTHDSGCISRYTGPYYYYNPLKTGQLDTIKNLFSANGLSLTNFEFVNYYSDTVKDTINGPYLYQVVGAVLTVNSLPVFWSSLNWTFHNGTWYQPNNYNPDYAYPGPDTAGHQSLAFLRSQFFKAYDSALYSNKNIAGNVHLARPGFYYHDSCLQAQLGYIDATWKPNSGVKYGEQLLKVWRITPVIVANLNIYRAPSPQVFVIDSTGEAWSTSPFYPGEPILFGTTTSPD